MELHLKMSDDELEKQIENTSLDPAIFTHEAQLRLAWIHIQKYGVEKAIENISIQLREYVTSLGAAVKFNLTLTIAAIKAMNHFIQKSGSAEFHGILEEFPRLKTSFKHLIETHYSTEVYLSITARQKYLEPDLLPFD